MLTAHSVSQTSGKVALSCRIACFCRPHQFINVIFCHGSITPYRSCPDNIQRGQIIVNWQLFKSQVFCQTSLPRKSKVRRVRLVRQSAAPDTQTQTERFPVLPLGEREYTATSPLRRYLGARFAMGGWL